MSSGIVAGGNGQPFVAGYCIPIRHQAQREKHDCWATCLAMIFHWKGIAFTREQIFASGTQFIPDYSFGEMATGAESSLVAKKLSNGAVSFSHPKIRTTGCSISTSSAPS